MSFINYLMSVTLKCLKTILRAFEKLEKSLLQKKILCQSLTTKFPIKNSLVDGSTNQ